MWIKLLCLASRSNLEDCCHSRELFSHSFERYAGSPHHETAVFYSIVIERQSHVFQDYVLSGLFSKICFAAEKSVISYGFFCSTFLTLTSYQGLHIHSGSRLSQGDLPCMSCRWAWYIGQTGHTIFQHKNRGSFFVVLSLVSRPSLPKLSLITCKQDTVWAA